MTPPPSPDPGVRWRHEFRFDRKTRDPLKNVLRLRATAGLALASMALAGCGAGGSASAGKAGAHYPAKPVTVLMPYAAGGPSDLTARSVAACLGASLGEAFVVENKPGGSGAVAMQELVGAKPDGQTLALGTTGTLVMAPMVNSLGYSLADVEPIGVMADNPTLIVVGADSPYGDAAELFAAARADPGAVTMGVPGATSPAAIELQRLKNGYGVEVTTVPASGNAEMTTNLLGGHVDALFINDHPDVQARIADGSFLPLAATTPERLGWLPEVPTLAELGFPDLVNATSIYGLFGPKGMPDAVSSTLERELETCLEDPKVVAQIGANFVPKEFIGADELGANFARIQALYQPVLGR